LCQRRRFALLRTRLCRHLSSCRVLCRSYSARREAGRSPGAVSDKIRDGPEPQNRQDAWPYDTPIDSAARRRGYRMRRREFITLLGGAMAAWPLAARAQRGDRVRRIGVLMTALADDPESLARVGAFLQRLQELGWTDGRNLRIEYRWGSGNAER